MLSHLIQLYEVSYMYRSDHQVGDYKNDHKFFPYYEEGDSISLAFEFVLMSCPALSQEMDAIGDVLSLVIKGFVHILLSFVEPCHHVNKPRSPAGG